MQVTERRSRGGIGDGDARRRVEQRARQVREQAPLGQRPQVDPLATRDVGVRRMRLMTNNPSKYIALSGYGLEIADRVPLEVEPTETTREYLRAKREKLGHLLKLV